MRLFLFWVVCVLQIAPAFGASRPVVSPAELIEGLRLKKQNAGLAVAVFDSQSILHLSTHGYADAESLRHLTPNSLFMIGSTTKAMTATAAGYLVQDGLLSWDQTAASLLPQFSLQDREASENATLRDFLLHRTGLPRHDLAWFSRRWTAEQYLGLLPLLEPSAPFRSGFQYQNLMYVVAGQMVGRAAETSWQEVMEETVFRNLAMNQTRVLASRLGPSDEVAHPHQWNGLGFEKIQPRDIDGMGPAGSVHSSILDMVKWGQFNLRQGSVAGGRSLDLNILAEIHRPQITMGSTFPFPEFEGETDYSFGWMIHKYRGEKLIAHNGGIDGYLSSVYFSPANDVGVVVLTNGGELAPDVVSFVLLDWFLGAQGVDWLERLQPDVAPQPSPVPGDAEFPVSYASAEGDFHHPAYGTFRVSQVFEGDQVFLKLDLNGGLEFRLAPWLTLDPRVWRFDSPPLQFSFHLNGAGFVERIEANLEPTVPSLQFLKVASGFIK